MQLINIQEASQLSGKSIQTIRRMIKQKKIAVKKQKTPQGFNYVIIKESLEHYLRQATQTLFQDVPTVPSDSREHRSVESNLHDIFRSELERFNTTIQKLVEQSERDKENFFQLIKTFQDRAYILENKIKMLEAPKKSRWKFWK